ncbi:hypothetical protein TG1_28 [Streptomyces phage TG1]|uniref:Uncharacterized protein n=1 Tax=Streptomyces phage TG1 TaxID=2927987 RepID=K4HZ47_9CAUD|nr:hypothetical protein D281_gp28 [Streptomyces phage TG1]AFU62223.1 hypothetical protein TG1_28 [Streptomyces phage TG1]
MFVSLDAAPALGDVRTAKPGDVVHLVPGVDQRADWGRYLDALSVAITRGASVVWVRYAA